MAIFEINTEDSWLPTWAQGNGLTTLKVRTRQKDGTVVERTPDGQKRFVVADEREIRHLEADPRFTRIS